MYLTVSKTVYAHCICNYIFIIKQRITKQRYTNIFPAVIIVAKTIYPHKIRSRFSNTKIYFVVTVSNILPSPIHCSNAAIIGSVITVFTIKQNLGVSREWLTLLKYLMKAVFSFL